MRLAPKLLWIDSSAALLAGGLVLALSGWLSELHALPRGLLVFTGGVNLLYGSYSFSLAVRARRPRPLITVLVVANLSWAAVCLGLAATFAGSASVFGMAHLLGEGAFVAGLASMEWRWREELLRAA